MDGKGGGGESWIEERENVRVSPVPCPLLEGGRIYRVLLLCHGLWIVLK